MLKSSWWFPREVGLPVTTFQIQQLCIHTQCSVIGGTNFSFIDEWREYISRVFIFRVWDLTREIRENKNPAKISTYTVININ